MSELRVNSFKNTGGASAISLDVNGIVTLVQNGAVLGAPVATTPSLSDNSTKVATTEFVKSQGYVTNFSAVNTGKAVALSIIFG